MKKRSGGEVLVLIMLTVLAQTAAAFADETGSGQLYRRTYANGPALDYYLYLPAGQARPGRVLVSVHGISRNVDEHLWALRDLSNAYGVALLIPRFDKIEFDDYQRLGRRGHGSRADLALLGVLREVAGDFGLDTRKVDLFGFSGGAQFAHRFAMAYPQRVAHLSLASAGWYTWPDQTTAYPLGLGSVSSLPGVRMKLREMLGVPTHVLVGARDIARTESLNQNPRIDRIQGRNRVQRATKWVNAMLAFAEQQEIEARISLTILPGTAHSFRRAVTRGKLVEALIDNFGYRHVAASHDTDS